MFKMSKLSILTLSFAFLLNTSAEAKNWEYVIKDLEYEPYKHQANDRYILPNNKVLIKEGISKWQMKMGVINTAGDVLIEPDKYNYIQPLITKDKEVYFAYYINKRLYKNNYLCRIDNPNICKKSVKRWGLMDSELNILIDAQANKIEDIQSLILKNGNFLGRVIEDNGVDFFDYYGRKISYYLFNKQGEKIAGPFKFTKHNGGTYKNISNKEYIIVTDQNDKNALIDADGKTIIEAKYKKIIDTPYPEIFVVKNDTNNYFYLNIKTDKQFGPFSQYFNFYNDFSLVNQNGGWGFIDRNLDVVIPFKFSLGKPKVKQSIKIMKIYNQKWVAFGADNNQLTRLYDYIWNPYNGYIKVKNKNKYGILTVFGDEVLPVKHKDIKFFTEDGNYVRVCDKRNKWSIVSLKTGEKSHQKYDWIGSMKSQLAPVNIRDKYAYIDIYGNTVIPFIYDYASSFNYGYALVIEDKDWYFINPRGEMAYGPFEYAYPFNENGYAVIKVNNKYGLLDISGNYKIPPVFDSIKLLDKPKKVFAQAFYYDQEKNMKSYFINNEGNLCTNLDGNTSWTKYSRKVTNGYKYGFKEGKLSKYKKNDVLLVYPEFDKVSSGFDYKKMFAAKLEGKYHLLKIKWMPKIYKNVPYFKNLKNL